MKYFHGIILLVFIFTGASILRVELQNRAAPTAAAPASQPNELYPLIIAAMGANHEAGVEIQAGHPVNAKAATDETALRLQDLLAKLPANEK